MRLKIHFNYTRKLWICSRWSMPRQGSSHPRGPLALHVKNTLCPLLSRAKWVCIYNCGISCICCRWKMNYVGVKLGSSHWWRNVRVRVLRGYVDSWGTGYGANRGNITVRSFVICTAQQILLLGWSEEGGWYGRGCGTCGERRGAYSVWWGSLREGEREYLVDKGVDGGDNIKMEFKGIRRDGL